VLKVGEMKLTKGTLSLVSFLAIFMLASCNQNFKEGKTSNMTTLSPRIKPMFDKTKSICFGRFIIDVPESANVAWGDSSIPLTVEIYPQGIKEMKNLAQEFIDVLKSETAIYHNDVPLLLSVEDMVVPAGKIITGYEDFESVNDLGIRAYFNLNDDGIVIKARPLRNEADETVALIKGMARRLRSRDESEKPVEPGNCIENAFMPDRPNPTEEDFLEHVRIGFRLREFPDAHLSIYIAPSNPYNPEGDSLAAQFKRIKEDPMSPEEKTVLDNTKFFRESARNIREWKTGYEVLMRTPDEEGSISHHDFQMKFIGVPHDPLKPYADIQFQTGVAKDSAGAAKASLTDDEAIAVWDRITSTIRVRPIVTASVSKPEAGVLSSSPVGEFAATGRTCPQTGWWEPEEAGQRKDSNRQHIRAGERMPHVITLGEPNLWQRLKGERPSYRIATVWKLVAYGQNDESSLPKKG
jgi:hypothetical protein